MSPNRSCRRSSPAYCRVRPHFDATFTISTALPSSAGSEPPSSAASGMSNGVTPTTLRRPNRCDGAHSAGMWKGRAPFRVRCIRTENPREGTIPPTTASDTLAKPTAQALRFSDIPARLSYIGLDGDPRVVPVGFWWTGETFGIATVVRSTKGAALRKNPRVALTIDRAGMPPRTLLVRGGATVEIVDGVPEEYVTAARKIVPAEAMPSWEAGVRALYDEMAVITVTPDHVVLHDFETTLPKAVADLIAAKS